MLSSTPGCGNTRTDLVAFKVTDGCGNSDSLEAQFIIIDTLPPTFTLPSDTLFSCSEDYSPVNAGIVVDTSDVCGTVTLTYDDVITSGVCPATDTVHRTWTAEDACGLTFSQTQLIILIDTIAPEFTVPVDVTIACTADTSVSNTGMVADTTDNCSSIMLSWTDQIVPGPCMGTDTIYRSWTAEDACENENTQIQLITRIDTVAPIITVAASNGVFNCADDPSLIAQWIATQGGAEATDNCSGVAWTSNYGSSPSGCLGDQGIIITFYATDSCNNVDSTSAYLSINDNTALYSYQ